MFSSFLHGNLPFVSGHDLGLQGRGLPGRYHVAYLRFVGSGVKGGFALGFLSVKEDDVSFGVSLDLDLDLRVSGDGEAELR